MSSNIKKIAPIVEGFKVRYQLRKAKHEFEDIIREI
jgi:hypothetical protein